MRQWDNRTTGQRDNPTMGQQNNGTTGQLEKLDIGKTDKAGQQDNWRERPQDGRTNAQS